MSVQLPSAVSSLLSFITTDCGLTIKETRTSSSFGDAIISLQGRHLRVRLVHDKGDWYVEASSNQKPDIWYDMALLQEQITNQVGEDVLDLDEQAVVFRARWQEIADMLTGPNLNVMHQALERRRQDRVKRRFPKWLE